ncbi:hypothetical protein [Microcoleus sp. Pol7_A1]
MSQETLVGDLEQTSKQEVSGGIEAKRGRFLRQSLFLLSLLIAIAGVKF